ncbi:MAG: immune inhibitor A [Actinomycetota bacterium]|nr:immune inhibitor A [Actinomycetota bacterium]
MKAAPLDPLVLDYSTLWKPNYNRSHYENMYFNRMQNDTRMTRDVPAGGELTAKVRYDIEEGWDYAFLEASDDGGDTWESIHNSEEYEGADQSGLNPDGTGISGTTDGQWVDLTASLPAATDTVRWRYLTDGSVAELGFRVDNITVDGTVIGDAETDEGWDFDGFRRTTGTEVIDYLNAYIVENRRYVRHDRSLRSAYNFGFLDSRPDWVEHFPYQDGMLVNYWDTSFSDNNVGDHPGGGLILPVDAHPDFEHSYDGWLLRPRILTYDSTFGKADTDRIKIHKDSQPSTIRSQANVAVFNDRLNWWFDSDEHGLETHPGRYQPGWYGVDVPKTGTKVRVVDVNINTGKMTVEATPAR